MRHEDFFGLVERGPDLAGDEVVLRHHVLDFGIVCAEKADIAVGEDTDELAGIVGNRNAADAVLGHNLQRVIHIMIF